MGGQICRGQALLLRKKASPRGRHAGTGSCWQSGIYIEIYMGQALLLRKKASPLRQSNT